MKIEIVQVERGGYNLPKISKVGIGAKHYGCAIQRKSLDKSWWHSTWMGFQTVRRFSMIFTTPIISFLHGQDMPRFSTRKKLNMLQQDSMCLAFLFFLYVSLCFFIAMCFRLHSPASCGKCSGLGMASKISARGGRSHLQQPEGTAPPMAQSCSAPAIRKRGQLGELGDGRPWGASKIGSIGSWIDV